MVNSLPHYTTPYLFDGREVGDERGGLDAVEGLAQPELEMLAHAKGKELAALGQHHCVVLPKHQLVCVLFCFLFLFVRSERASEQKGGRDGERERKNRNTRGIIQK